MNTTDEILARAHELWLENNKRPTQFCVEVAFDELVREPHVFFRHAVLTFDITVDEAKLDFIKDMQKQLEQRIFNDHVNFMS